MDEENQKLEKFRKLLQEWFIDKGIIPPQKGSNQEQDLYHQWLETQKKEQDGIH